MVWYGIDWIWNNPITREVSHYNRVVLDTIWPRTNAQLTKEVVTKIVEVVPNGMMRISSSARMFVRLAGLSGALAVGMGAYGAHVVYQRDMPEDLKQVYETANRYHFIHTLVLLSVPLCGKPKLAGSLLTLGTAIFCGSCYYYALTGARSARQFTPYGGMLLIAGWLSLVL